MAGKLKGGQFVSKTVANAALAKLSGSPAAAVPTGKGGKKRKRRGSPMAGKSGAGVAAMKNPGY
jgi:hypothetical protein